VRHFIVLLVIIGTPIQGFYQGLSPYSETSRFTNSGERFPHRDKIGKSAENSLKKSTEDSG
jgi:hypothetical protein